MTDKVLCPYCGAEMKFEENFIFCGFICPKCGATSPQKSHWNESFMALTEARAEAKAAALRRYTPPIKPMTLEAVWKEDEPMWVEHKNGALYIGDFYASMSVKNGWEVHTLGSAKPRLLLDDYYGRMWRCWERKPTYEERSAAKWET